MKLWTPKTYKRAAENHQKACEYMRKNINTLKREQDKKIIYLEIYYLSGYILECILKYFILSSTHRDEVTKEELRSLDLWTHEIGNLWNDANKKSEFRSISTVWRWANLPRLTQEWDSELRYESSQMDIEQIEQHYTTVINIFNTIKNIY